MSILERSVSPLLYPLKGTANGIFNFLCEGGETGVFRNGNGSFKRIVFPLFTRQVPSRRDKKWN
jgi:hypothetical protein